MEIKNRVTFVNVAPNTLLGLVMMAVSLLTLQRPPMDLVNYVNDLGLPGHTLVNTAAVVLAMAGTFAFATPDPKRFIPAASPLFFYVVVLATTQPRTETFVNAALFFALIFYILQNFEYAASSVEMKHTVTDYASQLKAAKERIAELESKQAGG